MGLPCIVKQEPKVKLEPGTQTALSKPSPVHDTAALIPRSLLADDTAPRDGRSRMESLWSSKKDELTSQAAQWLMCMRRESSRPSRMRSNPYAPKPAKSKRPIPLGLSRLVSIQRLRDQPRSLSSDVSESPSFGPVKREPRSST